MWGMGPDFVHSTRTNEITTVCKYTIIFVRAGGPAGIGDDDELEHRADPRERLSDRVCVCAW